mmetsp:Transcript_36808/g.117151  ORF Transcript_36808/g.117151 Transcript_36808/m.117151 type:complete len:85 (+) Transcript_36808:263-517(+)
MPYAQMPLFLQMLLYTPKLLFILRPLLPQTRRFSLVPKLRFLRKLPLALTPPWLPARKAKARSSTHTRRNLVLLSKLWQRARQP